MCQNLEYSRHSMNVVLRASKRVLENAEKYKWDDAGHQAPFIMGSLEGQLRYLIESTENFIKETE